MPAGGRDHVVSLGGIGRRQRGIQPERIGQLGAPPRDAVVVGPPRRPAEDVPQAAERGLLRPDADARHEQRLALATRLATHHADEVHAAVQAGHGEPDVPVTPRLHGHVLLAQLQGPAHVAEAPSSYPDGGTDPRAAGRLGELLDVEGRTAGIVRIDEPVSVVVAPVATDLEAACITAAIAVRVALCEVRDVHAIVAGVTDEVAVAVALIGIRHRRTGVADVGDAVAIAVRAVAGGPLEVRRDGVDDVVEVPVAVQAEIPRRRTR